MRTFPESLPQTIWCFFGYLLLLFFSQVFASFENNVQMKIFPASCPHTIWCFSDYFFCCFLRVLPVLRTMCRWTSSLHPFPILIDFFRVFASFENNLQMKTLPASFPHTIWSFSDYCLSLDFVFIIVCFLGLFFCCLFILDYILVFWSLWSLRVRNASVFDTEVWKWYCFSVGTTSQDLGGLVKWRVPLLVYGIDFWRAGIEHESLYAKQTRTD